MKVMVAPSSQLGVAVVLMISSGVFVSQHLFGEYKWSAYIISNGKGKAGYTL